MPQDQAAVGPSDLVTVEYQGHIAILTLNRPDKLNALNDALGMACHDALDGVAAAWPQTRLIVLTGAGRGFCAGGDTQQLTARAAKGAVTTAPPGREIVDLASHLRAVPQPVIAAINGVAIGAGLALACACDLRIASAVASFACPFIKYAMVPDTGLSQLLQRLIGIGKASEMLLTGQTYDAQWAQGVGLINMLVEPIELLPRTLELAGIIAAYAPRALHATKEVMHAFSPDLNQVVATERVFNRDSVGSADRQEAVRALTQGRAPTYTGN